MTEMVHGILPATTGEPVLSRWWRTVDRLTIGCILLLVAVGLVMVLAASQPLATRHELSPFFYFERHIRFVMLALFAMFVLSVMEPQTIKRVSIVLLIGGIVVLAALPFIGTSHGKGAVRWISIGSTSLQPSEFVKPVLIVVCGWLMAASQDLLAPPGRLMAFGLAAIVIGLLVIQPDMGQTALTIAAWGLMFFVSGASMVIVVILAGAALGIGVIAYFSLEYFRERVAIFLSPQIDERSQVGYALSAIQEGGFLGMGVGEGQVKWQLPDAHTDFVIAVVAEEYGFVMVAVILTLFAIICLRALSRLMRERDPYVRLAGVGLVALFSLQSMVNVGVAARLLPPTGMTLPLISQGGSSMLATGILLGMLLALTRSRPQGHLNDLMRNKG